VRRMPLVACHWPRAKQTRRPRRYAQATTRSKTTQHIIHDNGIIRAYGQRHAAKIQLLHLNRISKNVDVDNIQRQMYD